MEKYDRKEREFKQIHAQREDNAGLLLLYDLLSPEERRALEGMPLSCQDAWCKWMEEQHKQPASLQKELLLGFLQTNMVWFWHGRSRERQSARQELAEIRACLAAYAVCDYNRLYEGAYRYLIPLNRLHKAGIPFAPVRWQEAVKQLETALVQNNISYGLCTYKFRGLYDLQKRSSERCLPGDVQSLLYSGIACATHKGQAEEALSLYAQLKETKELPWLRRIGMKNRIAAAYEARLEPETAVSLLMENAAEFETHDREGKLPPSVDRAEYEKMKGRTYSCLGTALIFAGRPPEAYYERALDVFGADEGNRHITLGHLLHYSVHLRQSDEAAAKQLLKAYAPAFFAACLPVEAPDDRQPETGKRLAPWKRQEEQYSVEGLEDRQSESGKSLEPWKRQEEQYSVEGLDDRRAEFGKCENTGKAYAARLVASAIRLKQWNGYDLWIFLKCVAAFWMDAVTPEMAKWLAALKDREELQDANLLVYWRILRLAGNILYAYQGKQWSRQAADCYETVLEGCRQRTVQASFPLDLVTLTGEAVRMEYNRLLGMEADNRRLYARLKRQAAECEWSGLAEVLEKGRSLDDILYFEHV